MKLEEGIGVAVGVVVGIAFLVMFLSVVAFSTGGGFGQSEIVTTPVTTPGPGSTVTTPNLTITVPTVPTTPTTP
jgi:hypothetical protein